MLLKKWTDKRINMVLWKILNIPQHLRYEYMKWKAAARALLPAFAGGSLGFESSLSLRVLRNTEGEEKEEDYGVVSRRVITRVGVEALVKDFAGVAGNDVTNFNYHGLGAGSTAESSLDTALVSEFTTQYTPANTRATGTQGNPAPSDDNYFYETIGTNTFSAAVSIQEHGLFSQAAVPGGVLWDRSTFPVINLAAGDALVSTYKLQATAGG